MNAVFQSMNRDRVLSITTEQMLNHPRVTYGICEGKSMNRQCRNCGAPVPDSASVFCNKCGARMPAVGSTGCLICQKCGKELTDYQSLFCDWCGTPLAPASQPPDQVNPVSSKTACPGCGFENQGNNIYFCKKCGTPFQVIKPGRQDGRVHDHPDRNRAGGRNVLPQSAINRPVETKGVLPRRRPEVPKESVPLLPRRTIFGIMAVILILIAIAFFVTSTQSIPGTDADNSPVSYLMGALSWEKLPVQSLFSNQATPVVTDTPLELKNT